MSRGKKAKRKIGGRSRKQDSCGTTMVATGMRLSDGDKSVAISSMINKSCCTLKLSDSENPGTAATLRSKSVEIVENSRNRLMTTEPDASEALEKTDANNAQIRLINGGDFGTVLKSDELERLRNVLRRSDLSRTPALLGAIILGKVEVVERLLRDGYPVNWRSEEDRTTALMWAVRGKDLEMMNLLVRNGADLTLVDNNKDNVALIAVQSSSWEQNDFLDFWNSIDRKIDPKHVNISGCTILDYAKERHWDVVVKLMDANGQILTRIDALSKNRYCCCCCCSGSSGSIKKYRPTAQQVVLTGYVESTLSHLTILFGEIVNRYREIWSRDRHLGYPDYRSGADSVTASNFEHNHHHHHHLVSLRREEIARFNTVLPKLEESYLKKLQDCWSSLLVKMRQTASRDGEKFQQFVTSIQIRLLTHQVSPPSATSNPHPPARLDSGSGPFNIKDENSPNIWQESYESAENTSIQSHNDGELDSSTTGDSACPITYGGTNGIYIK